ncbi:MAG TPA: hypothetical protein DEP42_06295 [Ruminococcaceae bacterium]|nr:hypothetical protein [Oscillospiraceae bacterium]
MTPQAYGQGIREEGLAASRRLEGVFQKAIGEVREERQALAGIIGQANNRRDQWFWMISIGIIAFLFGVGIAPLLFNHFTWKHFDQRVASFIVGGQDRWASGAQMMATDSPETWRQVVWARKFVERNQDKIAVCQKMVLGRIGQQKLCEMTIPSE